VEGVRYLCDPQRHLVCEPFSIERLHRMAEDLKIARCWYHSSSRHKHYDIPKRRYEEISSKCSIVSPREILRIARGK